MKDSGKYVERVKEGNYFEIWKCSIFVSIYQFTVIKIIMCRRWSRFKTKTNKTWKLENLCVSLL